MRSSTSRTPNHHNLVLVCSFNLMLCLKRTHPSCWACVSPFAKAQRSGKARKGLTHTRSPHSLQHCMFEGSSNYNCLARLCQQNDCPLEQASCCQHHSKSQCQTNGTCLQEWTTHMKYLLTGFARLSTGIAPWKPKLCHQSHKKQLASQVMN